MSNPWLDIPLGDYEAHLALDLPWPRPFEFHHAGPLTLDRRNGPASLADLELLV